MPEWVQLVELKNEIGMKLPTLDGRFFCSRRDPKREAQSWLESQQKLIAGEHKIVVLGLGAGFHIKALAAVAPNPFHVIELRQELIGYWQDQNPDSNVVVSASSEFKERVQVLEFRPAWNGLESRYEDLSRSLRNVQSANLQDEAEAQGLWILAEALKMAKLPENFEITIKEIARIIPLENQSEEARLWRALRELVL